MMRAVKYVVFVPDGCADVPLPELDGRTPLEAARMPRLAALAARGEVGRAEVIPPGLPPGQRRRQHVDPRLRPRPLPHRPGADRGRGDGCRARARRSRVPVQPRDALRRRPAGHGRLRGRAIPPTSRATRSSPRSTRRSAADATACASIPASSTATCASCPRLVDRRRVHAAARSHRPGRRVPDRSRGARSVNALMDASRAVVRDAARARRLTGDPDLVVGTGREARAPVVRRRPTACRRACRRPSISCRVSVC